jgi:hypothetical protein
MMSNGHLAPAKTPLRVRGTSTSLFIAVISSVLINLSGPALAHEFTAALFVQGENRETRLAEAVRGFLLASDERDGHEGETSDGHLGGVDVHILPLPSEAASLVTGLFGAPADPPDVVVVLDSAGSSGTDSEMDLAASVVITPGDLPAGWGQLTGTNGFVMRYRQAYGEIPTETAALGYHAARRLDAAIRPLDGVAPRAELEAALRASQLGFRW